ncbi:hypothetical protein ACT3TD_05425 [Corynebacterium sp. AOP36-E1-14]|uniref:hypothetical protein n=1 Tax=unclassified Corynebacterium TaxID=2624378 RepID=UPI003F900C73
MSTISHVPAAAADGAGDAGTPAATAVSGTPAAPARERSVSAADRFMLRLLRVKEIDRIDMEALAGAHRAFRWAIVFSAVRCTITYLLVPILVPVISAAGMVATPLSITLCVLAMVNGTVSMRRFWKTDHKGKWVYTWFMAVMFVILIGTVVYEVIGLVS